MLLLVAAALAQFPIPTYPECGEPNQPELCPTELDGLWYMLSYVPAAWGITIGTAEETGMGSGMWVDRAFRVTTGRTDVRIAVLDSGFHWDNLNLINKWALNSDELPLPEGSLVHDKNGDGAVTVADYAGDSRIDPTAGQELSDTILDPSDLIATFSDGIDDDANGYTDDICGWDFMWDDNNPYDDTRYGHGTGIARDAAAEANDGGDIGTCPNCTIVPVRVGDSFVVDGSAFGSGLAYVVDLGVPVAAVAVGAVNQSTTVEAVVEYAWNNGTLVIGSAADETAYHPNPPGMAAHTFYVHAITHNGEDPDDSTSFLAYSNCTNHGVRLDGSASSSDCSSGATGVTAGIAGLVRSAALDAGWTPTPADIHAILAMTADDIALPDDPKVWPTKQGWDAWSGWGRLNAERAVLAASEKSVFPTAEIVTPDWFDWLNPESTPTASVSILAHSPIGEVQGWELTYGLGLEPTEWIAVGSGSGAADGLSVDFTLPQLAYSPADHPKGATPVEREITANGNTVQLRLVVTDQAGRQTTGRKSFYVGHDVDSVDGFPVDLGASLESSPAIADLDGDGIAEVIQADADGWIHALTAGGGELPGWPVHTEPLSELDAANPNHHRSAASWQSLGADVYAPVVSSPAIGDLDGDGTLEVVVATFRGALHVFGADGAPRSGFPVLSEPVGVLAEDDSLANCFFSTPALGDVDGDGALEVVIGGGDQKLYAWKADGTYAAGFPVLLAWTDDVINARRIVASPAIGDLDRDGRDDILIGTNETVTDEHGVLYAVSGTGEFLPGWPQRVWGLFVDVLPMVGQGVPNSAALVDLVGDESLEIVWHGLAGDVQVFDVAGEDVYTAYSALSAYGPKSNVSDTSIFPLINSPSIGDLNGDGVPDIVNGAAGFDYARATEEDGVRWDFDHALGGWSGLDGSFLEGFPRQMEDLQFFVNPAVADIDGDRRMEAINGSGGFLLHAWNAEGEQPPGWPKLTGQWIIASPAVGDIDGDGSLEVVVGTRAGYLFAWHTDSPADGPAGWVTFGHDNARTRNYENELTGFNAPIGGEPMPAEDCGCAAAPGSAGGAMMFAALAGLIRRRGRAS